LIHEIVGCRVSRVPNGMPSDDEQPYLFGP
jgi:hypothetical protein